MNKAKKTTLSVIAVFVFIIIIFVIIKCCGGNPNPIDKEIRRAASDCNINQAEMDDIVKLANSEGNCDCKKIEDKITKIRRCSGKLNNLPKCSCQKVLKPLTLALFIETSMSTLGYFQQNSNFLKSMLNLPVAIKGQNWKSKEFWIDNGNAGKAIINYQNELTGNRVHSKTSNIDEIIDYSIDYAKNNNLVSILVSDFILSPVIGSNKTLDNLGAKIASKIVNINSDFGVLVIRLTSSFSGNYYFEKNKALGGKFISQKRPYYIWFFGNSEDLIRVKKELAIESFPGYEKSIIFTKDQSKQNPYYTVLARSGKSQRSTFTVKDRTPNILERISFKSEPLKFSFAVNLNEVPVDDAIKSNSQSYILKSDDNNNYKIKEIKTVKDFKSNGKIKDGKDDQKVKDATHVITVEIDKMIDDEDNLKIGFKKEIPDDNDVWFDKYSTEDDTDITGLASDKTYGLKFLINGLIEGFYPNRNREKPTYFELNVELKK
jgi:hypothetical protein